MRVPFQSVRAAFIGALAAVTMSPRLAESQGVTFVARSSKPSATQDTSAIRVWISSGEMDLAFERMQIMNMITETLRSMEREFLFEADVRDDQLFIRRALPVYQSLQARASSAVRDVQRICIDSRRASQQTELAARRAWMGVTVAEPVKTVAEINVRYPRVVRVVAGSPAERAGVAAGDVIKKVDGVDVRQKELQTFVTEPGRVVTLYVDNGGKSRDVRVTLAAARMENPVTCDLTSSSRAVGALLRQDSLTSAHFKTTPIQTKLRPQTMRTGIQVLHDSLTFVVTTLATSGMAVRASSKMDIRPVFGANIWTPGAAHLEHAGASSGVAVLLVAENSVADRSGLRMRDIITKVNRARVATVEEVMKAVDEGKGKPIDLEVVRDRAIQRISIKHN